MHINIIQQYSEVYTGPVKFNNYSLTVVRMSLALMQSSNPNCSNWILFAWLYCSFESSSHALQGYLILLAQFKQSILQHDAKIIVLNVTTVVDPIESTRLYTRGKQILSSKGTGSNKCYPSI